MLSSGLLLEGLQNMVLLKTETLTNTLLVFVFWVTHLAPVLKSIVIFEGWKPLDSLQVIGAMV